MEKFNLRKREAPRYRIGLPRQRISFGLYQIPEQGMNRCISDENGRQICSKPYLPIDNITVGPVLPPDLIRPVPLPMPIVKEPYNPGQPQDNLTDQAVPAQPGNPMTVVDQSSAKVQKASIAPYAIGAGVLWLLFRGK